MRTRLPAALLLLLSTLFLAGGTTPPASATAAVHAQTFRAQTVRAADHQQILPDPTRPQAHTGKGVHAVGAGGLAVLAAGLAYGGRVRRTAVAAAPQAFGTEHHRSAPARAPPSSTPLT
ncbi:hypothetical protein ACFXJ8_20090 [Nonomuraea sp. NPDC059194]|uniref:hypothetical protein n=1 Tax=Nonomuraea sp. NPDC059194 TaxID=3346764 RepID=UPI00368B538D